jgi:hypothetical protein
MEINKKSEDEIRTPIRPESRLIFLPHVRTWQIERIVDGEVIQDVAELTAMGIKMRFPKEELLGALKQAVAELEAA